VAEGRKNGQAYAPGGKLWYTMPSVILTNLKEFYSKPPKTAVSLSSPEGQSQLDRMVDEIIEKDKLMSLGTADLGVKLNGFSYNGRDLVLLKYS